MPTNLPPVSATNSGPGEVQSIHRGAAITAVLDANLSSHASARRENAEKRVKRTLELFDSLPDSAYVDIRVICALRGRSLASTWRDVANGFLPPPIRIGARSTRWRVGDVRAALKGGHDV